MGLLVIFNATDFLLIVSCSILQETRDARRGRLEHPGALRANKTRQSSRHQRAPEIVRLRGDMT